MNSNNKGEETMLLNNFFKSFKTILNIAETSSEAQAIANMDIAIARLQQAKSVRLLSTDYLE
ncbi:hypothetical protein ACVBEE_06545 [Acinetobacter sp. ANC 3781]